MISDIKDFTGLMLVFASVVGSWIHQRFSVNQLKKDVTALCERADRNDDRLSNVQTDNARYEERMANMIRLQEETRSDMKEVLNKIVDLSIAVRSDQNNKQSRDQ